MATSSADSGLHFEVLTTSVLADRYKQHEYVYRVRDRSL